MPRRRIAARSIRFRILETELRRLRRELLPRQFNPTGSYRPRIHTLAASYRVLAHAEIEAYVEDAVTNTYTAACADYQAAGKVNRVVLCLVAFAGYLHEGPPKTFIGDVNRTQVLNKVMKARATLKHAVEMNHGVREENLCRLLLPIGVDPGSIDPVWLTDMETFGKERGLFAHSGAQAYRTTRLPDPKEELRRVEALLKGLKELDEILNSLLP